jgi:hypothetical protein
MDSIIRLDLLDNGFGSLLGKVVAAVDFYEGHVCITFGDGAVCRFRGNVESISCLMLGGLREVEAKVRDKRSDTQVFE